MATAETILAAQDRASAPMHRVEKASETMARAVEGAERKFEALKSKMESVAALVGVGFGLRELGEMFIGTNAKIETATRSLGGMISGMFQFGKATGIKNLEYSMERSKELMERFERLSMRTGLSVQGLAENAKVLAPAIAAAGGNTQKLADLTKSVALYSRMVGMNEQEGAMGLMMFLRFGMARHNQLLSTLGLHGQIYAKMSAQQRLMLLQKRIGSLGVTEETLKKFETFDDKLARVKSTLEIIAERAGKPLFDRASQELGRLADWLDKNQDKVKAFEDLVVNRLTKGFNMVVEAAQFISKHMDTVKKTVEAILALWAGKKAFGMASDILKFGGGVTGGAIPSTIGGLGKGLASGAGKFGSALLTTNFMADVSTMGIGEVAGPVGLAIAGGFMAGLGIDKAAKGIIGKSIGEQFADAMLSGRENLDMMLAERGQRKKTLAAIARDTAAGMYQEGSKDFSHSRLDVEDMLTKMAAKIPKDTAKPQWIQNFNNNQFDIMQQFAPGYDPDRVAVAFTADLAQLADKKVQSVLHPAFGAP